MTTDDIETIEGRVVGENAKGIRLDGSDQWLNYSRAPRSRTLSVARPSVSLSAPMDSFATSRFSTSRGWSQNVQHVGHPVGEPWPLTRACSNSYATPYSISVSVLTTRALRDRVLGSVIYGHRTRCGHASRR
jgi:hypothetical protein